MIADPYPSEAKIDKITPSKLCEHLDAVIILNSIGQDKLNKIIEEIKHAARN